MEKANTCCVCGENTDHKNLKKIAIKNKQKDICDQCVTAITGLQ